MALNQFNLLFLIGMFAFGLVTVAIFAIRYPMRRRDKGRSRGGTIITAEFFREYFFFLTYPFLKLFESSGINPNTISLISLILGFGAGILVALGHVFWAGWALAFSGVVDTLDGQIARIQNRTSKRGAFLDSVYDRYADFAVLSGYIVYALNVNPRMLTLNGQYFAYASVAALTGSALISYAKERAANLGAIDERGLMQRADRLLILCVSCIYDPVMIFAGQFYPLGTPYDHWLLFGGIMLIGVGSHLSAINRIRRLSARLG